MKTITETQRSIYLMTWFISLQVEGDDLPYFRGLRNKDDMQAKKRIHQMASMMVWSQDVHGIVKMSDAPRKTLYRSKTEKPVRKKTPVYSTPSLPLDRISASSTGSIIGPNIEEDLCYDIATASTETISTIADDDMCYDVV